MSKKAKSYQIIKELKVNASGKVQHVVLVDNTSEIMEFTDKAEAERLAELFEANSDSGYKYKVRKV